MPKNVIDYWIEASIREISIQAHFAEIAHSNINKKSASLTDTAFTSIHSFLSHCAMMSKMLQREYRLEDPKYTKVLTVGHVLGVPKSSSIHKRKFRNHLEHYDERIQEWVKKHAKGQNIGTYNIGSKSDFGITNLVFVSHYDPQTDTYTFVDEDLNLTELHNAASEIKKTADNWVSQLDNRLISPPLWSI